MGKDKVNVGIEIKAFDAVTAPLKKINASLESIRQPIQKINNSFRALSASAGIPQLRNSLLGVGTAAGRVGHEVFALGQKFLIWGGIAAAGIGAAVYSAVEAAGKLHDLSIATGIGVEKIQTLGYAFKQSGGEAEAFDSAITTFAQNLGRAMAGTGKMAGFFKKADPGFLQTLKKTKDIGVAMQLVVDRIGIAKTDAGKLAIAGASFGKDVAAPFVTMIKEGELQKWIGQMKELALTTDEIEGGEKLEKSIGRLGMIFGALKNKFIMALAPALTPIIDKLSDWFSSPDMKKKLEQWGKDLGDALPSLMNKMSSLWEKYLKPIWTGIKWIATDSTRLGIALGALALYINGPLILAIGGLAKSLIGLGITLLTTPIGWFILAIAGLAVAAYMLIKHWDEVKAFFSKMWDTPLGKFVLLMSPITWLVLAAKSIIANWEPIKAFFVGLWDSPIGKALRFVTGIDALVALAETIKTNWEPIKAFFVEFFEAVQKQITDTLALMEKFSDPMGIQKKIQEGLKWSVTPMTPSAPPLQNPANGPVSMNRTHNASVAVRFENLPRGARVSSQADRGMHFNLDYAYMGLQGEPA